ncbi:MAG: hypothetical protein ACTSUE_08050 [Promethearchaeota archaeon]
MSTPQAAVHPSSSLDNPTTSTKSPSTTKTSKKQKSKTKNDNHYFSAKDMRWRIEHLKEVQRRSPVLKNTIVRFSRDGFVSWPSVLKSSANQSVKPNHFIDLVPFEAEVVGDTIEEPNNLVSVRFTPRTSKNFDSVVQQIQNSGILAFVSALGKLKHDEISYTLVYVPPHSWGTRERDDVFKTVQSLFPKGVPISDPNATFVESCVAYIPLTHNSPMAGSLRIWPGSHMKQVYSTTWQERNQNTNKFKDPIKFRYKTTDEDFKQDYVDLTSPFVQLGDAVIMDGKLQSLLNPSFAADLDSSNTAVGRWFLTINYTFEAP